MASSSNISVNLDVAKRLDITCRKGDTFELFIEAKDSLGNDIDFTTYTMGLAQVRPTDDSSTLVLEFTDTAGTIVFSNGKFKLTQTATTMSSVDSGVYVYDIQLADASAKIVTWFYGLFKINEDVSI